MGERGAGDRRTRRTRKMLEQALLELIEEQSYEGITVQQIADRANVGRATFYLHYADKEQLLLATLQELSDDLERSQPSLTAEDLLADDLLADRPILRATFAHVARYRRLWRALLSEHGAALVARRLHDHLTEQAQRLVVEPLLREAGADAGAEPPVPATFLATFLSGALLAAITWWLDRDCREEPDEMARLVHRATQLGLLQLLGLDADSVRGRASPLARAE